MVNIFNFTADSDPLESEKIANITGVKRQIAKVQEGGKVKPSNKALERHGNSE